MPHRRICDLALGAIWPESTFTKEMSPTPGPDCLGLISNSDKTGSGQEHDLSYRIMVDAGLTPLGSITALAPSVPLMAFAAAPAAWPY
jgi:hypothetical protein